MKGKQCFIPSPWRSFLHLCWRRQLLPGHQTLGANQPLPSEARKRPRTTPLCLKGSLHTSRHPPQGHSLHCKHTLGAAIQWTWSTTPGRLVHVACCLTEREADVLDRALENRQLHGGQSAGVDVLCVWGSVQGGLGGTPVDFGKSMLEQLDGRQNLHKPAEKPKMVTG